MAPTLNSARRGRLAPQHYIAGILRGDRAILARAITVVESDLPAAVNMAQEFRRCVEKLEIYSGEQPVVVTCSLGVAEWQGGDTIDTLLHRADVALYQAKTTGRNKVVAADAAAPSDPHQEWQGTTRVSLRTS